MSSNLWDVTFGPPCTIIVSFMITMILRLLLYCFDCKFHIMILCTFRSIDEVNYWNKEDSPVGRLGLYLMKHKLWDTEREQAYTKEVC